MEKKENSRKKIKERRTIGMVFLICFKNISYEINIDIQFAKKIGRYDRFPTSRAKFKDKYLILPKKEIFNQITYK